MSSAAIGCSSVIDTEVPDRVSGVTSQVGVTAAMVSGRPLRPRR